jgi:RNA polymerase sigma factor (sigma-70 family)
MAMSVDTLDRYYRRSPVGDPRDPGGRPLDVLVREACGADCDPSAWAELIRRFGGLLMGTARRVGLNDTDAAEVVQLAWVRLWERGHQIRRPESLPFWLTATVRRESYRVARRSSRHLLSADPTQEGGARASIACTDVYRVEGDYQPLLEQALGRLPSRHQQLIRLLMSDTCPSYAEVAAALDLPVGSIGPMRMRALNLLRTAPELVAFRPAVSVPMSAGL